MQDLLLGSERWGPTPGHPALKDRRDRMPNLPVCTEGELGFAVA